MADSQTVEKLGFFARLINSIKGELVSRKFRAIIMGTAVWLTNLLGFTNFQSVLAFLGMVAAYIGGVAYEDGKAKSAPTNTNDTNINLPAAEVGLTTANVRTKRTSIDPMGVAVTETADTEVKV